MKIKLSRTERQLSVLVGLLTAMIVSGCASPDTSRLVARTTEKASYTVTIKFEDGCPKSVVPPKQDDCEGDVPAQGFCARPGESVEWVSEPVDTAFEVYFDPFVGRPYVSHPPHEKTSPVVVRRDSMPGKYKYSVVGVTCKGEFEEAVLDPPMLVEF